MQNLRSACVSLFPSRPSLVLLPLAFPVSLLFHLLLVLLLLLHVHLHFPLRWFSSTNGTPEHSSHSCSKVRPLKS